MADGPYSTYPRAWSRSVSNLEKCELEAACLARELQSRWPPSEYLVHIQVAGDAAHGGVSVRVWNSSGIWECEVAYPADHAGSEHPVASAALEEIECILKRLRMERKL